MIIFLLGEDKDRRDARIEEIRKEYLLSPEARNFDHDVLYAHKLEPQELKKSLISFPALAPRRLIFIHECHKLTAPLKDMIAEFAESDQAHAVLVMISAQIGAGDSFVRKLKSRARVEDWGKEGKQNVFDMTRAMTRRRAPEALKILSALLSEGAHPLQIMGGLVWFWGKTRPRLSAENFQKGLEALQGADLNIKRSRIKPDMAVEVAVVKLCELMN